MQKISADKKADTQNRMRTRKRQTGHAAPRTEGRHCSALSALIRGLHPVPLEIPERLFWVEIDKEILKGIWKLIEPSTSKMVLGRKGVEDIPTGHGPVSSRLSLGENVSRAAEMGGVQSNWGDALRVWEGGLSG